MMKMSAVEQIIIEANSDTDGDGLRQKDYNEWSDGKDVPQQAYTILDKSEYSEWVELLKYCDIATHKSLYYTRRDIEDALYTVSNIADTNTVSNKLYELYRNKLEQPMPSKQAIRTEYGTFNNAIKSVGLNLPNRRDCCRVSEEEVKSILLEHISEQFPNKEINKESYISVDRRRIGRADVVVEELDIVIECKRARPINIKHGVGQTVHYSLCGKDTYLCTHEDAIRNTNIDACDKAGIGLIGVSDNTFKVFVGPELI